MGYIVEMGELYLAPNYKRIPLAFVRGQGARLFTEDGVEYLDFTSGIAVCNLGHTHHRLVSALKKQAELLWHTSNLFYTEPQARLAMKLSELTFADQVFFANSGAESVEAALKLARKYAQDNFSKEKHIFIALENSFHGRTMGALSVTGQPKYWQGFEPLLPGVVFVPPNDMEALKSAFSEKVCAIILEPIQGEGGVYPLHKEFILLAKELCEKHKALLIFDEVQTGVGRTGKLFAYEHFDIEPDLLCSSKALANGLPLSALLGKKEVMAHLTPGSHASTFGGNPIACAVAIEVLNIVSEEGFLEEVALKGRVLKEKLEGLAKEHANLIKEVRGIGLLLAIEFYEPAESVFKSLLEKRVLVTMPKPNIIRLTPPLTINYREIDYFLEALEDALRG
ncbi:MAG: aspartate aminotransferase family protein [Thermodesulfobacterium sp.]|nr:aspartate aminotransferase family protein [Thermodesulfobacterium sp.]